MTSEWSCWSMVRKITRSKLPPGGLSCGIVMIIAIYQLSCRSGYSGLFSSYIALTTQGFSKIWCSLTRSSLWCLSAYRKPHPLSQSPSGTLSRSLKSKSRWIALLFEKTAPQSKIWWYSSKLPAMPSRRSPRSHRTHIRIFSTEGAAPRSQALAFPKV